MLSKPLPLSEILSEEEVAARKRDEDRQRALKERRRPTCVPARSARLRQRRPPRRARPRKKPAPVPNSRRRKSRPRRPSRPPAPCIGPAKTEDKPASRDSQRPPAAPAREADSASKRRGGIKTRGEVGATTGSNWRAPARAAGHGRKTSRTTVHPPGPTTEPIVRGVRARDDHRRRPRPQDGGEGHVDHGKTSLLDYIRRAKVAAGEPAASPSTSAPTTSKPIARHDHLPRHPGPRGLHRDAPAGEGHRHRHPGGRGRRRRDAADAGKRSTTPRRPACRWSVAINKIDKPDANPERVTQELTPRGIPEAYGGDTMFVSEVSAKKGTGHRRSARRHVCCRPKCSNSPRPRHARQGPDHRGPPDKGVARWPPCWSSRHAAQGDVRAGRRPSAASARDAGRNGQTDRRSRSVHPGRNPRPVRMCRRGRRGDRAVADEKKARESRSSASASSATSSSPQQAAKLETHVRSRCEGEVKTLALIIKADVQGSRRRWPERCKSCPPTKSASIVIHGASARSANPTSTWRGPNAVIIGFNHRADAGANASWLRPSASISATTTSSTTPSMR